MGECHKYLTKHRQTITSAHTIIAVLINYTIVTSCVLAVAGAAAVVAVSAAAVGWDLAATPVALWFPALAVSGVRLPLSGRAGCAAAGPGAAYRVAAVTVSVSVPPATPVRLPPLPPASHITRCRCFVLVVCTIVRLDSSVPETCLAEHTVLS